MLFVPVVILLPGLKHKRLDFMEGWITGEELMAETEVPESDLGFNTGIPRVEMYYTAPAPVDTTSVTGTGALQPVDIYGVSLHCGVP